MTTRRSVLAAIAAAVAAPVRSATTSLNHKERVDRALKGSDVDRPPFSFWHHFGLNTPETHAEKSLSFHRAYHTDIVKVMSDFPYPKPSGRQWYQLKVEDDPFPQQIKALELIRDGLDGRAYFIETIFNPWNVAEKLAPSKEELLRLKAEKPQALLDALDVITRSEINHARRAMKTGASGLLVSVANANSKELSPADYERFSLPFDKRFLEATSGAKLTFLHLHVEPEYLHFFKSWPAPVINYSQQVSGIPIVTVRKEYPSQVIAGGIDEVNYRKLSEQELKEQIADARKAAGPKFILTPGCSVPNESTTDELTRLPKALGV
jgi:uroporphyrinogen-III decarboxylase